MKTIKYSTQIPPIYYRLKEAFGVNWDNGLIIANGDTIHCKFGDKIGTFIEIHEKTHLEQQARYGLTAWWNEYITNPHFRLLQEIEAYTNEVSALKQNTHLTTRDQRRHYISQIVDLLSGAMYGNICTKAQAEKLFK